MPFEYRINRPTFHYFIIYLVCLKKEKKSMDFIDPPIHFTTLALVKSLAPQRRESAHFTSFTFGYTR